MSAFIVEKSTIDAIVTHVSLNRDDRERILTWFGVKAEDELGQALWSLNVDAFNARYPKDGAQYQSYQYGFKHVRPVHAYKALECLIYQCSEGNVPETATYKNLERLLALIGNRIISSLPEYDAARWG
jgi:hypothetical protein